MPSKSLRLIACLVLVSFAALVGGCSLYQPTRSELQGAGVGAATGAVAGALLDSWRGGVIGAAIGAVAGAAITHIATRASTEAATANKPVAYTNDAGTRRVEAAPKTTRNGCKVVEEKYYEDGKLVRTTERTVCN